METKGTLVIANHAPSALDAIVRARPPQRPIMNHNIFGNRVSGRIVNARAARSRHRRLLARPLQWHFFRCSRHLLTVLGRRAQCYLRLATERVWRRISLN